MTQEILNFKKELKELRDLYNQLSGLTHKEYIDDLEQAEKKILELEQEIKSINNKISVGTLDKDKFIANALKKIRVGDVS